MAKPKKHPYDLEDGPWKGETLFLDDTSDGCTAFVIIGRVVGRYVEGKFQRLNKKKLKKRRGV